MPRNLGLQYPGAMYRVMIKPKPRLILGLLCLALCSCSHSRPRPPLGDDPSLVSAKRALELCQGFLRQNGYPNAQVTGEIAVREYCTFSFSTNGTSAPIKVVVDRKSRKVRFDNTKP
jgi:hypothetical protein